MAKTKKVGEVRGEAINKCPVCMSDDVWCSVNGKAALGCNMMSFSLNCKNCGASGKEWYELTFSHTTATPKEQLA